MPIDAADLVHWTLSEPDFTPDPERVRRAIETTEATLGIRLPDELKELLALTNDRALGPLDTRENMLARYAGFNRGILVSVLHCCASIVNYTLLLQESIYDHRTLLPNGLIALGSDYDDDGDAYIIYDVRVDSPTYGHLFHWRYYGDDLVPGQGLGLLAGSLKAFLHSLMTEQELEAFDASGLPAPGVFDIDTCAEMDDQAFAHWFVRSVMPSVLPEHMRGMGEEELHQMCRNGRGIARRLHIEKASNQAKFLYFMWGVGSNFFEFDGFRQILADHRRNEDERLDALFSEVSEAQGADAILHSHPNHWFPA